MDAWTAQNSKPLSGVLNCPPDKSISHRGLLLGAIAKGTTTVHPFLQAQDCLNTLKIMQMMGVNATIYDQKLTIKGVGLKGFHAPDEPLDCGNSGTAMRLLVGLLVAQDFDATLVGDASLSHRPMGRVITPLTKMGAKIKAKQTAQKLTCPLEIFGRQNLRGIEYASPVASAQVKTAVLLAGLHAKGPTHYSESEPSRDHTERLLKAMGAKLQKHESHITLDPGPLSATDIEVPGDISSAAFFIVAATLIPGSHVFIKNVGLNPTRLGIIEVLQAMGADITLHPRTDCIELQGDIEIKSSCLKGILIPRHTVVTAMDEFPIIFVAAAFANGRTRLLHAPELRVKESDRLAVMGQGLEACGVDVRYLKEGIEIQGGGFKGGKVSSFGDHRVAMAFAVAGCASNHSVEIEDVACTQTSFPEFLNLAQAMGMTIHSKNTVKESQ